jgi:hypothetical protein
MSNLTFEASKGFTDLSEFFLISGSNGRDGQQQGFGMKSK